MKPSSKSYIPALGYRWLTRFYDPVVRLTTREATFKEALRGQASIQDGHQILDLGCGTGTLALIETELGHYVEAMNFINEAIRLDPAQSYYINNRGYIFLLQGALVSAEADINTSITKDPNNAWAYRNKGIFYFMKGDYPSARRLLEQAEKMDSFIDRLYYYLGQAYWKNGMKDLACKSMHESEKRGDTMSAADWEKRCK